MPRKFLYELQEKASTALAEALLPEAVGRKSNRRQLLIDETFVQRAITLCLSVIPGTVRTVQTLLDLLLGVQLLVGCISQRAQELGAAAQAYQHQLSLPILALAEADYHNHHGHFQLSPWVNLIVVDRLSIYNYWRQYPLRNVSCAGQCTAFSQTNTAHRRLPCPSIAANSAAQL